MSQENVEILRRGYRAFLNGDYASGLADLDADFVAKRMAPMPDVDPYHGREGMLQILADWVEGFDKFEMSAEEFLDANENQVVVRVHQRAVGAQSRAPIEADFWMVHTLRDGKVLNMDIYASETQALKAVGLEE